MRPQGRISIKSPAKIKKGKRKEKVRPSIFIDNNMRDFKKSRKPHTNGDSKMNPTGIHDKKACRVAKVARISSGLCVADRTYKHSS